MEERDKTKKLARWYFGGVAAAGAACITHPLDLIKVHLQTQQHERLGVFQIARRVVRIGGVLALYTGLTASLIRQLTYTTTRFGIYEVGKQKIQSGSPGHKLALSCLAGFCGGVVGTPADVINVRMQNDIKLPLDKRRNYRHVFDGFYRVYIEEGPRKLFSGVTIASTRAILVTAGQLLSYDYAKAMLIGTQVFHDTVLTHFISSLISGSVALLVSQPVDVIKTRVMNAKPGEFTGLLGVVKYTAQEGPKAFFKGIVPSGFRILPFNIILFIFYEQLRLNFGFYPMIKEDKIQN